MMRKQDTPVVEGVEPILSFADVMRITGLSRSTIYRMRNDNSFPDGLPLGKKKRGWLPSMLVKWQQDMKNAA